MALARKRRDGLGGEGGIKRGIILKYGQIKTAGYDLRDVPLVRELSRKSRRISTKSLHFLGSRKVDGGRFSILERWNTAREEYTCCHKAGKRNERVNVAYFTPMKTARIITGGDRLQQQQQQQQQQQ
uniref:Uncharacterized protein n=1 Tax=Vespula pensylvanica TaxID=30213 RepID=A0A834U775_VESPE|nr:hypothetical protein H0235_010126 [Vespula pensylvanica]